MKQFTYSENGLALTMGFEGLSLKSYQDSAGIWTIGYGHTGPNLVAKMAITQANAEALLRADLADAVTCVNRVISVVINQDQFDALVDFCFNAGRGALLQSTLLRNINVGDFDSAAAQFGLWVHAGGKVVAGLVRRRKTEAELFSGEATEITAAQAA
jgi:lysozyme